MSSYCVGIDGICKYCDEDEGCLFYSQGSGNVIDKPCYETNDKILALYEIQELCKELDIEIEITSEGLLFKKYWEENDKPHQFKQIYSLIEIEKYYDDIESCAEDFIHRLEKEHVLLN